MSSTRNATIANNVFKEGLREVVRQNRKSPDELTRRRLIIRPNGEQCRQPPLLDPAQADAPPPAEIWIRLTEPCEQSHGGAVVPAMDWDFPAWLKQARSRWAEQEIDWYFLSFGSAFMKQDLFEVFQAVAESGVAWRTHFLTDGQDLTSMATIDALLRSPLQELQVYVAGLGGSTINRRVLEAVKDLVDLREARGQNHPDIICRLCPSPAGDGKLASELSLWARPVGIDRLEVVDKVTEEQRLWG